MRKKLLLYVSFTFFVFSFLFPACSDPNTGGNGSKKECSNHQDCWNLRCPDKAKYKECVNNRLAPVETVTNTRTAPEYVVCKENKCKDIPTSQLGGGQIDVVFPKNIPTFVVQSVKYLMLYIFDKKDMKGNDVTCQRLKDMLAKDPSSLMKEEMGRYYPPRDDTSPTTVPVARAGSALPLLFSNMYPVVPAFPDNVVLVLGFCETNEGRPNASTKPRWIACKENVAFKAGNKANTIEITLPLKSTDSCF